MNYKKIETEYRHHLNEVILPFWEDKIDEEHGGLFTCVSDAGKIESTDKYIWSQCRAVWTFSAVYNRIDNNKHWLLKAANIADFIIKNGRDKNSDWVFSTNREGVVIEGFSSIFSSCFAFYGLNEYYRASKDKKVLDLAVSTFERVLEHYRNPLLSYNILPYHLENSERAHGVPMILVECCRELYETTKDPAHLAVAKEMAETVLTQFLSDDGTWIREFMSSDGNPLPPPKGTIFNPGHAIESMWFILRLARTLNDDFMIQKALKVIRWNLENGWDDEYGGLFLALDIRGRATPPDWKCWDSKAWWPQCEALYALLLAYSMTGESWTEEWYAKIHKFVFSTYPNKENGEWFQRMNTRCEVMNDLIALPVKDPFHTPRVLIYGLEELDKI